MYIETAKHSEIMFLSQSDVCCFVIVTVGAEVYL